MLIGTVVGQVWATRKEATLEGLRMLVVRPWTRGGDASAETVVEGEFVDSLRVCGCRVDYHVWHSLFRSSSRTIS